MVGVKVFISYPRQQDDVAHGLEKVLNRRGLEVIHLDGTGTTGYEARLDLERGLKPEDGVVFIVEGAPTWHQRTVLSEVVKRRWAGEDVRIVTVTTGSAALPGVLTQRPRVSADSVGWEVAVADALTETAQPVAEYWTPARRRQYRRSLDQLAREVAADASAS